MRAGICLIITWQACRQTYRTHVRRYIYLYFLFFVLYTWRVNRYHMSWLASQPASQPATSCIKSSHNIVKIKKRCVICTQRHRQVRLIPPQPHCLVLASAADALTIGAPIYGVNLVLVSGQISCELTRSHGPHLERRVLGRRNEQSRISRECALVHGSDVAAQGINKFSVTKESQLVQRLANCKRHQVGGKKKLTEHSIFWCGYPSLSWQSGCHQARM